MPTSTIVLYVKFSVTILEASSKLDCFRACRTMVYNKETAKFDKSMEIFNSI